MNKYIDMFGMWLFEYFQVVQNVFHVFSLLLDIAWSWQQGSNKDIVWKFSAKEQSDGLGKTDSIGF